MYQLNRSNCWILSSIAPTTLTPNTGQLKDIKYITQSSNGYLYEFLSQSQPITLGQFVQKSCQIFLCNQMVWFMQICRKSPCQICKIYCFIFPKIIRKTKLQTPCIPLMFLTIYVEKLTIILFKFDKLINNKHDFKQ